MQPYPLKNRPDPEISTFSRDLDLRAADLNEGVKVIQSTILFGKCETFAVEFARAASPNYIHVRLWIAGDWVGDINDTLMPEFMCAKLLELACPFRYPRDVYDCVDDVPTYDELFDQGGWSFGESFDPFALACLSVRTSNRVYLNWRLHEAYYYLFPEYPRREYHGSVAMADYRIVVKMFVAEMTNLGYYVSRPGHPLLAELEE